MTFAAIAHDAGSSELICAFIHHHYNLADWHIFALPDSPMATICLRENIPFIPIGDVEVQLSAIKLDVLLFGTGWQEKIERPYVTYCKKHAIPTVAFLDHWSNYRERFGYPAMGWEENCGDFTAVHDEKAYTLALSLKLPNVIKLPNFYLQDLIKRDENHSIDPNENLLFLSEPTDEVAKRTYGDKNYWGFTQYTALEDILKNFDRFKCEGLTIRLHPSETSAGFKKILNRFPHIHVQINDAKTFDLTDQLLGAKMIIGFDTMALYIATLLGKAVISYLPSKNREFLLPLPITQQLRSLNFPMAKNLKALIVGAGSIGGLIDSPDSEAIASHAHAYTVCPDTQLSAICEPYEPNVLLFWEKWGKITCYPSINELPNDESFDIASIASSTTHHAKHLLTLLQRSDCPLILCEKPLVATEKEFYRLKKVLQESDKRVLIHLMRRYNPSFIALSDRLHKEEFGNPIRFSGACTKGLLHNGSHLLAVLTHFFGKIMTLSAIHPQCINGDLCGEFAVTFDKIQGVITVLNTALYSFFELTLWYENGVVKIIDGGQKIEIFTKVPSSLYEGYFTLELTETIHTDLSRYALHSLEFLLHESDAVCKAILNEHLDLHEIIFQTLISENVR
ncbi:MAG: Gfo/Idh/MocA family oxidoreductase [Campylobacterales bacterium]|nr:Gfo/Idh/MocA family oxidoreductase [Campylobacterales bacterium]